jgi:hypothetical protein
MGFTYPPLPSGDGLRILTLLPGSFWDPLEGALESVPFSRKPKYLALSYTWADPDPAHANIPAMPVAAAPPPADNAKATGTPKPAAPAPAPALAPYITLDGQKLALQHNATMALRFLRSTTHPLPLWLDAACIDQNSIPERNAQVALMAFIFTRAAAVVGWLGVPEPVHEKYDPEALERKWRDGLARETAARFAEAGTAGGAVVVRGVSSSSSGAAAEELFGFALPLISPDSEKTHPVWHRVSAGDTVPRVQLNRYWTRLWVVQEVCLPRNLVFVFGGEIWPESAVRHMLQQAEYVPGRVVGGKKLDIQRLLQARQERFTDSMRLEALVERFMDQGCAEVRDRVFGLVGLANDVDTIGLVVPDPKQLPDRTSQQKALDRDRQSEPVREKRGRALMEIDYNRPLYKIWMDVVSYMYFRAKPMLDFGNRADELEDERRARLVRFAGVVQTAFEGRVDKEVQMLRLEESNEWGKMKLRAKGYIAGTILHLGPAYSDYISSYREQQLWLGSWDKHYAGEDTTNLRNLREMEETYSAKIIDYTETDIARICTISGTDTIAWSALEDPPRNPNGDPIPTATRDNDPVRFLGTNCCLGLAPPEARCGDHIIRFWNCDAAIVMRPETHFTKNGPREYYELVGRIDIAEPYERRIYGVGESQADNRAKDLMRIPANWKQGTVPAGAKTRAVYVDMEFETLQQISAAIAV